MEESLSRLGGSSMHGRFCRAVIKSRFTLDIFQTFQPHKDNDAQQSRRRYLREQNKYSTSKITAADCFVAPPSNSKGGAKCTTRGY